VIFLRRGKAGRKRASWEGEKILRGEKTSCLERRRPGDAAYEGKRAWPSEGITKLAKTLESAKPGGCGRFKKGEGSGGEGGLIEKKGNSARHRGTIEEILELESIAQEMQRLKKLLVGVSI